MSDAESPESPPRHVRIEIAEAICTIRFDRPEKKNALTTAMYADVVAALRAALTDDAVRVVRFIGTPGLFTAGNDLGDFMSRPPSDTEAPVFQLLSMLPDYAKPIVAAVDGPAIGLGTTMLLHCDLVVATARARLQMPFIKLGLVPEAASSLLLPSLAGLQRASEWLLLGEAFSGTDAHSAGLVNRLVAPEDLEAESLALCRALAARPPEALRQSKALLRAPLTAAIRETMQREGAVFLERLRSPEALQAFTAFFDRPRT